MNNPSNARLRNNVLSLAASMPAADLEKLLKVALPKELAKGETLLAEGQLCAHVYFVEQGYLRSFINRDGAELNLDFVFEGNFATDLKSLRLAVPSETSLQAGEHSLVWALDRDALLALYQDSPAIESFGRKLLEQLLMAQDEHLKLFKMLSPAERYRHLQTHYPQMLQRISLTQLASYLGVARETLSRIRKIK